MLDIKLLRKLCDVFGGHLFICEGKSPINTGWQTKDNVVDSAVAEYTTVGFAIDAPDTVILDIDSYRSGVTATPLAAFYAYLGQYCNYLSAFTVHTPRGGTHLYLKCSGLIIDSIKQKCDMWDFVDVQTAGKRYVIAPTSEINGQCYTYTGALAPIQIASDFFTPWQKTKSATPSEDPTPRLTPDQLRVLLAGIPAEEHRSYDQWIKLLFSAKHATGGSMEALDVFIEWSRGDAQYNTDENVKKIRKFWDSANRTESACTLGTLLHIYDSFNLERPDWVQKVTKNYKPKKTEVVSGEIEFETDSKDRVKINAYNLDLIFSQHEAFKEFYRYNTFSNQIENKKGSYVDFDSELVTVRQKLYTRYPWARNLSLAKLQEAITLSAHQNQFNSLQEKLNTLSWDGQDRIDNFFSEYCGTENDAYHREVGRLLFRAAVKRAFKPGCKYDHVIIFVGEQGFGKSSLIDILSYGYFISLATDSHQRAVEEIQGSWLVEINELVSMRKREIDDFKQFISTRIDTTRLAYARSVKRFPRTCIFLGTTNSEEFLKDETGHRRFIPVEVGRIDLDRIRRDRNQLWAEAVHKYQANPSCRLELPNNLNEVLSEKHAKHEERDEWESAIDSAIRSKTSDCGASIATKGYFTMLDLWRDLKGFSSFENSLTDLSVSHSKRIGKVLRQLGYGRKTLRKDGAPAKVWVKK